MKPSKQNGFSLIDLMAIIVVLGLLLLMCIPAFGRAGMNSKGLRCLSNVRQLCNAWRMYADDNRDRILYAATDSGSATSGGSMPVNSNPGDSNNYAWSGAHLDYNPGNPANYDVNFDINKRLLWPYAGKDASIYKCPEDQSSVRSPYTGMILPRVQSMAMNTYLGGFAGTLGGLGGWEVLNTPRLFLKTTEFTAITPARLFVFTDQRPDYINWSNFTVDMTGYSPSNANQYAFADMPGSLHDGGAAFSFADGHGELHRWQDARTMPPMGTNGYTILDTQPINSNNPDIAWLQDHATRPR